MLQIKYQLKNWSGNQVYFQGSYQKDIQLKKQFQRQDLDIQEETQGNLQYPYQVGI